MVKYWIVFVLVISPIVNAWKSSTEDHREPTEYHREPKQEHKDSEFHRETAQDRRAPTKERRDLTKERLDLTKERRDLTKERLDLTKERRDLTKERLDLTKERRDLTKERRDPTKERRDPTKERRGFTQDRKDPIQYRRDQQDRRDSGYRREPRELRRTHYQTKRHMLPDSETKRRSTTSKPTRDVRKKPSGHLTPLEDDDMENDEVVSVAIGPPPLRGKYEKPRKKLAPKPTIPPTSSAVTLVKELFTQITKEFLTRDVDENFVFGQYLGNAMKNLTSELRLSMQHEILELIVKYQKANRGDAKTDTDVKSTQVAQILKDMKVEKKLASSNDTEEPWPDFSNLAKIVG